MIRGSTKKIVCVVTALAAALLGGCQSRSDESSLRVGSESGSVQSAVSETERAGSGSASERDPQAAPETDRTESTEENDLKNHEIYITVGESTLTAVLEENESAKALTELLAEGPFTIPASNYGGFEKVCALGTALPRNDVQTTARAGDICLYSGDQIVIFYGSNSWSYTRLGKISDADGAELERILGGDETELTLSFGDKS